MQRDQVIQITSLKVIKCLWPEKDWEGARIRIEHLVSFAERLDFLHFFLTIFGDNTPS